MLVLCPWTQDTWGLYMKNQDILLLLKLLCLELGQRGSHSEEKSKVTEVSWTDWKNPAPDSRLATPADNQSAGQYSVRSLAAVTGISKSEVSSALQRCFQVGLAIRDKKTDHPKVNKKALLEFLIYGLRYIFPAKIGRLSRGISTTFSAPVLKKKLLSAGDSIYVGPMRKEIQRDNRYNPFLNLSPLR